MTFRKTLSIAIAIAAICFFNISGNLFAAAPIITYTASGTFASTPTSGADTLKLAGEPFSVTISVSASTAPFKNGSNWAAYDKLKLTGSVHSGLVGPTPVTIASGEASIIQAINPTVDDQFTMEAPVKVVGINLTIKAVVAMPLGTITKPLLHPFALVNLTATDSSVSYSDGTNTTVLAIQSGTLTATIPAAAAVTQAALDSNETQPAAQPVDAEPVRPGKTSDLMA